MGDAAPAARPPLPRVASCMLLARLYFASIRPLPGLLSLSLSPSFHAMDLLCAMPLLCDLEAIRQAKVHLIVQLALLCDLEAIHLLFSHFSLTNLDGYRLTAYFFCIAYRVTCLVRLDLDNTRYCAIYLTISPCQ